jgi:hypothetical protein
MGVIKKIQYDCRSATYLIEKGQEVRLSIGERIRLFIHLRGCSVCRLFRKQSTLINRAMRGLFHTVDSRPHSLDEAAKQAMQEKINQRLS